jgi:excisionase family DNA binding protein
MFLTVDEVAKVVRVSPATVRRLMKDGVLPSVSVGKQFRVASEELNRFLKRPTAPISTRSSRSSRSSNGSFAAPKNEPSTPSGCAAANSLTASPSTNAETTSETPDTDTFKCNAL